MGFKENGCHLEGKLHQINPPKTSEIPATGVYLVKHDLFMSTSVMSVKASMEFAKFC